MKEKKLRIGMLFPGQGAQFLGMGKDLYNKNRIIQDCFEAASKCLGINFVRLCFASSEKEIRMTTNAQTSIFLLSVAIAKLLKEKYDIKPDIVAGHSSGEYAALVAAGGMNFSDALYLLKKRTDFMEEATKKYPGGMLAVVGMSLQDLKNICEQYDGGGRGMEAVAEIVNYNSPTQFVISGTLDALSNIQNDVKTFGGKAIPLNVSGAFHSRLMQEAAKLFAQYMVKVDFNSLHTPLVNNVNGEIVMAEEDVQKSLAKQMSSPVQWWPSMQRFKDCDVIIEMGPGTIYSRMLAREWPNKKIIAINESKDIIDLLIMLGKSVAQSLHEEGCEQSECAQEDIIVIKKEKKN